MAGELVVSAEMACATAARELDVEPLAELSLYVIHGLLHLCGFDDHDDADISRMRQREDELLALNGLTHANHQVALAWALDLADRESLLGPKGGASTIAARQLLTSRKVVHGQEMSLVWMVGLGLPVLALHS